VTEQVAVQTSVTGAERQIRKGGEMRQVTNTYRSLIVLAVGLLALAAPLIAYASDGGPQGS
jgi:hypothetical protein